MAHPGQQNNLSLTPDINVISGVGASRTLNPWESGSLCLLDASTGVQYTLPAPYVGMYFDFVVTASIASGAHVVITDAGTTFLLGGLQSAISTSATTKYFIGNGTSTVKVNMAGTTTGGLIGTAFRVVCISATQWAVYGLNAASGVLATAFA